MEKHSQPTTTRAWRKHFGNGDSLRSGSARLVTCDGVILKVRHILSGVAPWEALEDVRNGKFRLVGMVRVVQRGPLPHSKCAQQGLFTYAIQERLANSATADKVLLPAYGSAVDRGCRLMLLQCHITSNTQSFTQAKL